MSHPEEKVQGRPALSELADDPASRKKFLKLMGGGVAGASAFSLFLAACGGGDDEAAGTTASTAPAETEAMAADGDLKIVNYALTLEYLEADFYAKVIDSGLFSGASLEMIKVIGDHEQQHVDALLGTAKKLGEPAAKPETTFPLDSADSVLELAATVENLGAAAYLGQAGVIKDKEILAAAIAIHSVEARHAAALNILTGKSPTPDGAFAAPLSMEQVLPKVQPFIVS
ncbi:MAG: ferritin-like domain-containing protein [Actinobacteria bacterium]|nr:ferritin-like domain-containing protein [Actinomycetota bacterium]